MSFEMTLRLLRLASWCLLGAALGAGLALILVATREVVVRARAAGGASLLNVAASGRADGRAAASGEISPRAAHDRTSSPAEGEPIPPASGHAPDSGEEAGSEPGVAGSGRTARICLMALGTHKDYRTHHGGRYDLMIVSPEDKPSQVLHKARLAHPGAKVFAYLNTMDIMLSRAVEGPRFWSKRESWFLHDGSGERIRVRVKSYTGELTRHGMNVASAGWQGYLAEKAVRLLKAGYDGIQLDNVETAWSYRLRYIGTYVSAIPVELDEEGWYEGEVALLRAVRKAASEAGYADREFIFNHIRAGEPEMSMRFLAEADGANAENWMDAGVDASGKWGWESRVDLARKAAAAGKRTNLLCETKSASATEALFVFGSYLMAMEPGRSSFWYGIPYRVEGMPWYDFYGVDLGPPSGGMSEVAATGVFRREFEKGIVLVNPGSRDVGIDLGRAYWDDLYEEVDAISLDGKAAAILLLPEGDAPARRVLEAESCVTDSTPAASAGGLVRVNEAGFHGAAAVMLEKPGAVCSIDALVAPGRYRVVVEGRGRGRDADAIFIRLGDETRRIAFDRVSRRSLDIVLTRKLSSVDVKAAEPGVIVDRITLIRLGDVL